MIIPDNFPHKKWDTWILDSEEIFVECQELNLSPPMIKKIAKNIDTVAKYFDDKVAALVGDWDEVLRDAIQEVADLIKQGAL